MKQERIHSSEWLQRLVEEVSIQYFSRPFRHQAIWNKRLQSTGGRYHLKTHCLDFNPRILEYFGEEVLIRVVKHELCHYHLHLENRGYRHRDKEFKELLKQVDGLRFVPRMEEALHTYQCVDCQKTYKRHRRIRIERFRCGGCNGRLEKVI